MKKLIFTAMLLASSWLGLQAQIIKSGNITTSETWTNNNIYILNGFVYVKAGATLTIEPGTIIKGDFNSKGALIIERDAKIYANGTKEQPIVMTSQKAVGQRSIGDWGGLIIAGKASVNQPANAGNGTAAGEAVVEGGVGTIYGGGTAPDDNDSSGVVRYLRIEFGGIPFQPNSEINGITMCGVGRKTVIEHVQVSYGGDDAFEWFGGTVNGRWLIAYRNWDDDFDSDFGYSGNVQFGLVVRDPDIADQSGSNGFESDNDATGTSSTPITSPNFSNVTVIGPLSFSSNINSLYRRALHLRRNTRTSTYNSVFTGYPVGLLIESSSTQSNATNGDLQFRNSVLAQMSDSLAATTAANPNNTNGAFDISAWFNTSGWNNQLVNTTAELGFKNISLTNPDFSLLSTSNLLSGADFSNSRLQNSFFTPTTYRGAFGTADWTDCWAEWDPQNQPYNGAIDYTVTASIAAAGLTTFCQGGSVTLNVTTNVSGASYLWSNGETTSSIMVNASNNYNVTVTSSRGCTATATPVAVTVNPNPVVPVITASGNTSFCTGGSVDLTSSYATGNVWSTGATSQTITVTTSQTITVTHTDGNNCFATSSPTTTSSSSSPQPTVAVTGALTFCEGGSVTLTASLSDSYSWSNGATSRSIVVTTGGSYVVTATNADPCDGTGASNAIAVTVNTKPTASATVNVTNLQAAFTNTSSDATSYIWDFGDGSAALSTSPTHNYAQPGNYTVKLIAENANCADTATIQVSVTVGIEEKEAFNSISLYPNPASNIINVKMDLVESTDVEVMVYDITGKLVAAVHDEKVMSGLHVVKIDIVNMNNGLYIVAIKAEKATAIKRLLVNK
jgi:hypothetical protein